MKRVNYYKLLAIPAIIILALLVSFCKPRESQIDSKQVAEEKNKEKFSSTEAVRDAQLVTDVVASGLAQIRYADLALEKSRDEELKQIALQLKNQQAILLAELTNYASSKVITIPLTESTNDRANLEKLKNETTDFNKKWCNEVQKLSKQSIKTLEKGQKTTYDPDLKAWIDNSLPTFRKDLDLVSACHNRVK